MKVIAEIDGDELDKIFCDDLREVMAALEKSFAEDAEEFVADMEALERVLSLYGGDNDEYKRLDGGIDEDKSFSGWLDE